MSFNTDWDVEKYKSPFECEEHWDLRKNFLITHKDKYPEQRLICLAQVFFNVELLGCRYPQETMELIEELSEGIADSFREKKQRKLQRTFIKASDAAGARLKGLPRENIHTILPTKINCSEQEEQKTEEQSNSICETKEIISVSVVDLNVTFPKPSPFDDIILLKTQNENFFENGCAILQRSLSKKKIYPQYSFKSEGTPNKPIWKCILIICEKAVSDAFAVTKQNAKKAAVQAYLNQLQNTCFTLEEKVKILSDGSTVDKNVENVNVTTMTTNNIGNKIMKLMGWKGGGLGRTEQGRSEPIMVQDRVHRLGLGTNLTQHELMKKLNDKLRNYAKMDSSYDLVFSTDFSKEERAKLHTIAQKFHLKTRSYGSGKDRYLVVSRRIENHQSIIETLINCGGENERYRLILPVKLEINS